jgi:hypothetical protein
LISRGIVFFCFKGWCMFYDFLIHEEWIMLQVGLAIFFLVDQLTSQVCNMFWILKTFTQLT